MVESGALEVSEEVVADALEFAHAEIRKIVAAIRELHSRVKPQKVAVVPPAFDEAMYKPVSYTHLDVYKRQVQRNPDCCDGAFGGQRK